MGEDEGNNSRKINFLDVKSIHAPFISPCLFKINFQSKEILKPIVGKCKRIIQPDYTKMG